MSVRQDRSASLTWRAGQLQDALEQGRTELDPRQTAQARDLVNKVRQRWALKGGRTVVALAGATGSGKSTLFNALVGESVSPIGVRRPTTAQAAAAVWGEEEADRLLDWLDVGTRHHVAATGDQAALDGLVLVDLPDFDSVEATHRAEADRVLERADAFVWVADPQKYADARLHEEYLAPLQDHEPVMLVVLNQVDRLADEAAAEQVAADLRRLVAADGAGDLPVIAVSARMGWGMDRLRGAIGSVVAARNAAETRLVGDVRGVSRRLLEGVAPDEPAVAADTERGLVQALARAAGVPVVLDAVERDYRRQSAARAGWPVTRWLRGFRPDPLARLRLGDDSASSVVAAGDVQAVLGRSSLPPATPAARSAVRLATRDTAEQASQGLPPRWRDAVITAADPDETSLADALDQAVLATPLRGRTPLWWPLLGGLQVLLVLAALAGAVWLTALAVMGWLQVPVEAPLWGPVPVPLLLLCGGLLLGLLLGVLARAAGRVGARRRRREVERRLTEAIAQVAREHVRAPVTAVLDRHRQTRMQLEAAGR